MGQLESLNRGERAGAISANGVEIDDPIGSSYFGQFHDGSRRLFLSLVAGDLAAVTLGWLIGWLVFRDDTARLAVLGGLTTAIALAGRGLYRSHMCTVRTIENALIMQACLVAVGLVGLVSLFSANPRPGLVVVAGPATFLLVAASRAMYRATLMQARREGRQLRRVVVVGTNAESADLIRLMAANPAYGFVPVGAVGPHDAFVTARLDVPWLGEIADLRDQLGANGVTGVVIANGALGAEALTGLVHELLAAGVHVQLSTGLRGLDHRRVVQQDLAYEPLLYVRPADFARWRLACKRVMDIVGATLALVVLSPFLLVSALAVKLTSPGPVVFRQRRVGRDGERFTVFKLRTMVDGAEESHDEVAAMLNDRVGGPLFKSADDPRRTRVGRVLERLSLDEVPQLFNVLRGEMSLVGPRPALPSEIAQFDERLRERLTVKPGVTGIWQLEARDDPHFETYRRLDLYYIENWSLALDATIILGTIVEVAMRGFRALLPSRKPKHEMVAPGW